MLAHSSILRTCRLEWPDEAACEGSARTLASHPEVRHATIAMEGPLGAGKTTFTRALLRALGVEGRIKSPSFSIVESYEAKGLAIAHIDLYRLSDEWEWESSGLRDTIAADGLKVVEWPSRAGTLWPTPDLHMGLTVHDTDGRSVVVEAFTPRGVALLEALRPA